MTKLEFLFDVGSPTTYLAWTQLPALSERTGAEIKFTPVLLGGIFKATGNASPVAVPAKGAWMLADLDRFARRYGVPLAFNPHFPINTLGLMRAAVAAQQMGLLTEYLDAVFPAFWVEQLNMGDPEIAAARIAQGGIDAAAFFERTQSAEVKDRLRQYTESAVARGAFGAPTFFVGGEMFFGQDRLDFVEEALQAG